MKTAVTTKDARSSMMELCENIACMIGDMSALTPELTMGYSLEPEEIPVVMACVEQARAKGQVKGSRMAWYHAKGKVWLVFQRRGQDLSCLMLLDRPSWIVPPVVVSKKLVPIMVPEHLVKAMRLHLGQLANSKEEVEA